jgi:methionine-rich copper-binding protein CopC
LNDETETPKAPVFVFITTFSRNVVFWEVARLRFDVWSRGAMQTTLKRSLIVSLFFTLGWMVAPASAFAEAISAVPADGPKVEAASCGTCMEVKAGVEESISAVVARSPESKALATRAKHAKNRREWLQFVFEKDKNAKSDREFFLGTPTRAERAESRRQWWDFAFGVAE